MGICLMSNLSITPIKDAVNTKVGLNTNVCVYLKISAFKYSGDAVASTAPIKAKKPKATEPIEAAKKLPIGRPRNEPVIRRKRPRQDQVFAFLQAYEALYRKTPTYQVIADALEFTSRSCVSRIMSDLVKDKRIRRVKFSQKQVTIIKYTGAKLGRPKQVSSQESSQLCLS